MRNIVMICGLAVGLAATASGQTTGTTPDAQSMGTSMQNSAQSGAQSMAASSGGAEQQVGALDDQLRQAALSGDMNSYGKLLADDYVGITPTGDLGTKQTTMDMFKSGALKYSAINQHDRKIQMYGNTALITGLIDVKMMLNGKDMSGTYRVSRVWVNQGGTWKRVFFQSTPVPSAETSSNH